MHKSIPSVAKFHINSPTQANQSAVLLSRATNNVLLIANIFYNDYICVCVYRYFVRIYKYVLYIQCEGWLVQGV